MNVEKAERRAATENVHPKARFLNRSIVWIPFVNCKILNNIKSMNSYQKTFLP